LKQYGFLKKCMWPPCKHTSQFIYLRHMQPKNQPCSNRNLKSLFVILIAFAGLHATAQEEYKIKINDVVQQVALDKDYEIMVNGEKVHFSVSANDTLAYNDSVYSFQHLKDYKIAITKLSNGLEQAMMLTAEGSGFIIQKYASLNPTKLNETMLNEATKENLSYGYTMKRTDYRRTLKSGQEVMVTKAVLTYKDLTSIYEIASLGKKDEGILILTIISDERLGVQGRKMIDLLWQSFQYKQ
jgi:hypothetical protein